ncbi:uncharacterized protein Hqrw_1011 [Haloquadratum walsbyi C23]|jgi:hypothetical protein|uniref:Uncharacterized protein n=3 Tax=Haloquadratum walsbyi TaxID=293091 RepID=Q18DI3_HALWD|nr:uncharacterized protein HQ_1009A [Haloquadratum walsbyi DSM 16790]CCC38993.1 uncharacterized protein Hqrw_1011 [Haloquadratum walsbyi C23]
MAAIIRLIMSDDTSQQSTLRTDGGISSIEIGFPAIAFGLHAILALALIPFAWDALQAGNFPLVGSLALLSTLILILGAMIRRVAKRRF